MTYFQTIEAFRFILNEHFPKTKLWEGIREQGTSDYAFITALSTIFSNFSADIQKFYEGCYLTNATEETIVKWEQDYSLPDEIFSETQDLDKRKSQIIIKKFLIEVGINYKEDYFFLANYFGIEKFDIQFNARAIASYKHPTVYNGKKKYLGAGGALFTWIVYLDKNLNNFGYPKKYNSTYINSSFLNKFFLLLKKIKPIYTNIVYSYTL